MSGATVTSIQQPGADGDVPDAEQEEDHGDDHEDDVGHMAPHPTFIHRLAPGVISDRSRSRKESVKAAVALDGVR